MRSSKLVKRAGLAAAGAVAAGAFVLGGTAMADAATGKASPGASAGATAEGGRGGGSHTAVTGDELVKVTAAVQAKDSAVTVTSVRKDGDGSYDVFGTKAGAAIGYDVSADLKTLTERTGRGEGKGHGGGSNATAVTGDELAKVTAAAKAHDAALTVTGVRKDPDGSYDVAGTRGGTEVDYDVSADLKTFTQRQERG
ncbi:hypothetical protein KOI35_31155 [Actinoplanes bogorensis]|uniref:PepSY domain-containing protein n=1 Tax=Paractinoplanes bogorensis TaxID=1610840 RepID=A0ABS5YX04_9ACTN|nr:hypothetical protein [Actinoplanes bogorensis]MBU2667979.1 hypothetical protein [Actinoplanes bogorensis]